MIRTRHSFTHVHGATARPPKQPKPEPEPVPGVTVRCGCGRVVRARKSDGRPVAHNYCRYAPATTGR